MAAGLCHLHIDGTPGAGGLVICLDPFFHYHGPVAGWYYELSDQRSQNDGITRHFTYDAVITGTSMTENFRTTEFDALMGTGACIKLPIRGPPLRKSTTI